MELTAEQVLGLTVQLAMGISLAACAGLRAFLPLLVVGACGRLGFLPLADSFEWLASSPALVVFGVAVVTELLADKFPGVDHFLDAVQVWVKPIAGTILVASVLTEFSPLTKVVLGVVLGGSAAEAVHLLKAKTRILSTVSTAGFGNPLVSTAEDATALVGSVGALVVPLLVFVVVVVVLTMCGLAARRMWRSASGPPQPHRAG